MPANTVYVGRGSRFGNPWTIGLAACGCRSAGECTHNTFHAATAAEAVDAFKAWIGDVLKNGNGRMRDDIARLRGKNLACWCPLDQPCHADVLLELANGASNA